MKETRAGASEPTPLSPRRQTATRGGAEDETKITQITQINTKALHLIRVVCVIFVPLLSVPGAARNAGRPPDGVSGGRSRSPLFLRYAGRLTRRDAVTPRSGSGSRPGCCGRS